MTCQNVTVLYWCSEGARRAKMSASLHQSVCIFVWVVFVGSCVFVCTNALSIVVLCAVIGTFVKIM